ncbi:MAG: SO_0444 family Cu/Zn efflux transporter [Nitrospinota bacterium]
MDFALSVIEATWEIARESAVYILFGFTIAGFIKVFVPIDTITKYLKPKKMRSVVYAAIVGIPLPLCSCGVLPTALALRKQGASKGATTAFLISTPESGVDSIAITYALMDPLMTVFRPIAAFFTATLAGFAEVIFDTPDDKDGEVETCSSCASDGSGDAKTAGFWGKIKAGIVYAMNDLMDDMAKWLAAGFIVAGLITALLPEDFFTYYLDSVFLSMLLMLAAGIPLYVCATSSTPVAAALVLKGLNPGAALVFLLAGPATNAASLVVLSKVLGKRTVAIYLVSIAVASLLMGYLLNGLYIALDLNPMAALGGEGEIMPAAVEILSALLLFTLMARSIVSEFVKKSPMAAIDDAG